MTVQVDPYSPVISDDNEVKETKTIKKKKESKPKSNFSDFVNEMNSMSRGIKKELIDYLMKKHSSIKDSKTKCVLTQVKSQIERLPDILQKE